MRRPRRTAAASADRPAPRLPAAAADRPAPRLRDDDRAPAAAPAGAAAGRLGQSSLRARIAAPVPTPVTGVTTPAVLDGRVAVCGVATASGVVGAYIASSNDVVVGCWRPTANTDVALAPANEVEM